MKIVVHNALSLPPPPPSRPRRLPPPLLSCVALGNQLGRALYSVTFGIWCIYDARYGFVLRPTF